nr:hypothetical protein [uncultured Albidiferax sp.]
MLGHTLGDTYPGNAEFTRDFAAWRARISHNTSPFANYGATPCSYRIVFDATVGRRPVFVCAVDCVVFEWLLRWLLAHTRSRIANPIDLAGKRVGAVARTFSQYFLELYLLTIGLNPQNLT